MRFALPIPPLDEQTAIAAFLDRETAKIDALVAEQRRLIELLKEKRQAVISHAVTKGLNPHAPMKPSGIEWLGDVPEHWKVRQVKLQFVRKCRAATSDRRSERWLRVVDIRCENGGDIRMDLERQRSTYPHGDSDA